MEVFHQGQMFVSRRLPWHPTAQGTRDEGQMEDGQYPGGHGARAEAHDLEDDNDKQEVAAWEPARKCHGSSAHSYTDWVPSVPGVADFIGLQTSPDHKSKSVHHPWPPLPLQLLGITVTDPGQFSWKPSSGSPAHCPSGGGQGRPSCLAKD